MTNNYESVDYDECRLRNGNNQGKKSNQKPLEYTADTFAVYSVQENNIYEDERYDDFKMDVSKPKTRFDREEAENNYIMPVANHGKSSTATMTMASNNRATMMSSSATMTGLDQIYNTSQQTSPPSIYGVKYLVDLNDIKQHLSCDNCHSTKTLSHHGVPCATSATAALTGNNVYQPHLINQSMNGPTTSSNANLLDAESIYIKTPGHMKSGESAANLTLKRVDSDRRRGRKEDRRRDSFGCAEICCCVHACSTFLHIISRIFKCFKICCCAPCCSTAALLGAFGAIGGLLAGFAFLGVFGIIPIPMELTRLICNASAENQKFYYYNNNLTIIKEIGNFSYPPGYRPPGDWNRTMGGSSSGGGGGTSGSRPSFTVEKRLDSEAESRKIFAALNKNASIRLKAYNKYKNMVARLVPLSYNVVFSPSKLSTDSAVKVSANNHNTMEMKIDLDVQLFCNHSTNLVHISTKEFSNIELNLIKSDDSTNQIKRWKHDLESNILEIETVRNCTVSSLYELKLTVVYKNFGTVHTYEKSSKQVQKVSIASFMKGFENPFPLIVQVHSQPVNERLYVVSPGPSVFNITLVRKRQSQNMLCNMDILKKTDKGSLEYIYFKSSPLFYPYFITLLFGEFNCKELEELTDYSVKLRICWLSNMEPNNEVLSLLGEQTKLLFDHLSGYTKKDYQLDKLDIVVLPKSSAKSLLAATSQELKTTSIGLVFMPDTYTQNYEHFDYLNKLKLKFKITNVLSKQLVKYWFYSSNGFHCETNSLTATNENDVFMEKVASIRGLCSVQNCSHGNNKSSTNVLGRSVLADLQIYQSCVLYKAIVNWVGYLAFQSVYPDLFDLLKLEWSLVKEIDSDYFLDNKNINHIYENYEFPILAESSSFKDIKSEIKSMELVKAIFMILGEEKFENLIRDWFKMVDQFNQDRLEAFQFSSSDNVGKNNRTSIISKTVVKRTSHATRKNSTIFSLLQQHVVQYDLIPFQDLNINDIFTSWVLGENDIIVNIERSYNKKEALIKITSLNKPPMIDFYYPLNWCHGSIEINFKKRITLDEKQPLKTVWLNQTMTKVVPVPGADQWIIGNSMSLFGLLRVNYDHQNWLMLTERLRYDYESLGVNERAQIIDDMFYLVNNQLVPISYGLNLLEYISKENRYLPWKYAIKHIKTILDYVEDHSQIYSKFREYVINLVRPMYKRLQWGENYLDTFDEKLIRILVVDLLCSLDHDDCVENSVKQLTDIIKINVNNIPDYLTKIIYCTAIRHTSIKEWQYLWEVYLIAPENTQIKHTTLFSLSCSSQVWILNLLFNQLVYDNSLTPTDLQVLVGYISKNPAGKYVVWNHISQNYQLFYDRIGNDPDLLVKLIQVATVGFKLKYEIKQVYNFMEEVGLATSMGASNNGFANNGNSSIVNSKEKLFNSIESRIARFAQWKASNGNDLDNWLKKKLSTIQI